jgi:LAO/AO transport system kinase
MGGVARKTREAILLCEAAGFDTIIVETVGVGQSEIAVHSMVDFFLLLMLAGAGDSLQGIKRGVVEMADALAITKADGDNINNARQAIKEYKNALKLFPPKESGWKPRVLACSSLENTGIDEIWQTITQYFSEVEKSGYLESKRRQQAKHWMHETIRNDLESDFYNNPRVKEIIGKLEKDVTEGRTSSFTAAKKLLDIYLKRSKI